MLWDPSKDKPVEPVLDEIGQVMMLAADYLETHRWGQGDFVLANGAVCLMGALIKIETGKVCSVEDDVDQEANCPKAQVALDRITRYLNKDSKLMCFIFPFSWNDAIGRKKSEVIAVLREAVKLK